MATASVYRKHDSFVALRQRGEAGAGDALARIRAVSDGLDALGLPEDRRAVLRRACDELLGASAEAAPFALHAYVTEEIRRLSDEELPRYLWYRYRYETYPARRVLDAFPPCVQIEPTSVCNYRCTFCYQTDRTFSRGSSGHMGMMSLDLFKRVVDQTDGRCEAVTLASRGEPLLCPELPQMLAYARGKFLALKLNTNASKLDERACHAILEAGVNTVVFSADAADEADYEKLRVGGELRRVLENIRRFQRVRSSAYPQSRTITRVSGVSVEGASTIEEMQRVWGEFVDQVAFVAYNPWEHTYTRPLHDLTTPCSDLWRRMFVWWDGTVNPCDADYKSTLAVGRAREQELSALWRSEAYEHLRARHAQQQRSACSPCNRCTVV